MNIDNITRRSQDDATNVDAASIVVCPFERRPRTASHQTSYTASSYVSELPAVQTTWQAVAWKTILSSERCKAANVFLTEFN